MESKTIKVSNVKENEYGIQIGYKPGDGPWENYFVNEESLFPYFTKGATVVVEYAVTKSGNRVIKGVSTASAEETAKVASTGRKGGYSPEERASIQKQTVLKVAGEIYAASAEKSGVPTAFEFAAFVNSVYNEVFGTVDAEQLFEEEDDVQSG